MAEVVKPIQSGATDQVQKLVDNVAGVLKGKREIIKLALVPLLARGHLLLDDVPGVGKTTLARAIAASLGVTFRRLQCTSDLMPSDVLGANVYDPNKGNFEFRPGPVFTNVLLADEINRTTPKTQSALLEAMEELQVSIDGETRILEKPFFVIATQNPHDDYGTYPLPESQLDRFLLRLEIGYPSKDYEREVLRRERGRDPVDTVQPVMSVETLKATQSAVDRVRVEDSVLDYLHNLILLTRETPLLELGVSTRGALALERAVRALALIEGRDFAIPDDVKLLAEPLLSHRLVVRGASAGDSSHNDAARVIRELLGSIRVPV